MSSEQDHKEKQAEFAVHQGSWLVRILLPVIVLVAGVAIAFWMMQTGPQAKKRPRVRNAPLVEVMTVETVTSPATVTAMGSVRASREVDLKPQVSGQIIAVSPEFVPGGVFREGQELLRIDPVDYQLAVDQAASEVARVEADLSLERGNQLVAAKEYSLLGEEVSAEEQSLILRQPQLETLRANLAAARSRLEQARNDLARTRLVAPFDVMVASRESNLGAYVNAGSSLARLVGTDAYWVEVSVPVSQLRWIEIPAKAGGQGSPVRIYDAAAWGPQVVRPGTVIGLAASLESQGRMAQLLVEVPDPLALRTAQAGLPRMLIDAYVRVEIEGRELQSVVKLNRDLLRDGNTVWLMDAQDRLEIRPVQILFRGEDHVLVNSGLAAGEQLIVSNLSTPVAGMTLRLDKASSNAGPGREAFDR